MLVWGTLFVILGCLHFSCRLHDVRPSLLVFMERKNVVGELFPVLILDRRRDEKAGRIFVSALNIIIVQFLKKLIDFDALLNLYS